MEPRANRLALKVAMIYIIVAECWIFISDWLLDWSAPSPGTIILVDVVKDTVFAILSAALLYKLLQRALERWELESGQRRQAELAQHDSEEKYRRIFDMTTDAVFLVDCETTNLLDANPAAERMYGYTHEEFLRLKASDVSAEPEKTKIAIAAAAGHVSMRMHRRKDHGVFPVEISCSEFFFQKRRVHVAAMRDITERKRMETALQLSDFSVNHASLPTFWIAPDSRIVRVNGAACRQLGYSEPEMLELTIADLDPKAAAERWPSHWEELRAQKQMFFETGHRHKNGHIIPVEVSLNWFEFDGQEFNLAYVKDISERKLVEGALRTSEEKFRQLAENIADVFWITSPDLLNIHYVSPAYEKIWGRSLASLYENPHQWVEAILPEDRDHVFSIFTALGGDQSQADVEYQITRPDGGRRWIHDRGFQVRDAAGRLIRLAGLASDITDRKRSEAALRESEERLRKILQKVPVAMCQEMQDGSIVFRNERFIHTFGYTEEDAPVAAAWLQRAYPDPAYRREVEAQWTAAVRQAVETGGDIRPKEYQVTCKSGEVRTIEISGTGFGDGLLVTFLDLTARKMAEAALRESEYFFKESQRAARIGSYKADFVSDFWESSEVLDQIFGIDRSYRRNIQGWLNLIHADDVKAVEEYLRNEVIAGHRSFEREYRIIRPIDGEIRWVSGFGEIGIDATGNVTSLIGTIQDITERKLAGQKIIESRATLEAALASMTDAVFISDANGKFIEFNDAFATFHRFKTKADCAGNLAEYPNLLDVSEADGKALPLDRWAVPRALRGEVVTNAEYTLRRKDTGETWVGSYSFSPIRDRRGTIIGAVVVGRDITESKRAAEKLARLAIAVDQAAEAIVITDTRGTMVYVNPAFERITGYTSAEALGQNPRILKSDKQDNEFYRQMWSVIARGEIWSGRFVNRRKDGVLFEEEVTISPIRDTTGKVVNYVAVKRDVTREVQLESQYRQAQKMEAIGTLAGGIAHDFNNILAAMFGYGYLVREDVAGNAVALENIEEILNAASRAKDLVQQILTFSRQREQKRQVVRLHTVVKEAVKFLRASLPAGIHVQLELDPEAPAVLADPTQIYQVILNLGTNAFHAMEGRNGALTISLQTFEPGADFLKLHPEIKPLKYASLMVSDTGDGMDAKTLERMFEPFFTTKPVGKGTGLGLAVVHGIVQSHEAGITVASEVGRGTTFTLYFPAQAESLPAAAGPVNGIPSGNGQRILVIDDEKSLTTVLHRLLGRMGYHITTSNNPVEAYEMFSSQADQFDAIITDLTMPDMNGVELAQKINRLRPDLPILLASGFNTGLDPVKLRECGIRALIEKPVSMSHLSEALAQAIGSKASPAGNK